MSKRLFIDIETLPPTEEMRNSINPVLVSTLENGRREPLCEAGAECSEEQFRHLALHAEYGRALAIGLKVAQTEKTFHHRLLGPQSAAIEFPIELHCLRRVLGDQPD